MEKNNIETQKGKPYFYACCPMCKRMLLQSANGADCYIKCVQCGSRITFIFLTSQTLARNVCMMTLQKTIY